METSIKNKIILIIMHYVLIACMPLVCMSATALDVKTRRKIGLTKRDLSEISRFIQSELPQYVERKIYYLSPARTHLARAIEYDPQTKETFVILKGRKCLIGKGKKKKVYLALRYHEKDFEIVARGEQTLPIERELEMTKKAQGMKGLFVTYGMTQHSRGQDTLTAIYSKLYNKGSLKTVLEQHTQLTLYEKARIMAGILRGLESLHNKHIVHLDLGTRNYLIDISPGKKGTRTVRAVVADLGRAKHFDRAKKVCAQGNSLYRAPEVILNLQHMQGRDYCKTDIYAAGCVFYQILFGKFGRWQKKCFMKDLSVPAIQRYHQFVAALNRATGTRRKLLASKGRSGTLDGKEYLEFIILRMLHPDPEKRPTARELRQELGSYPLFQRESGQKRINHTRETACQEMTHAPHVVEPDARDERASGKIV